MKTFYRRNLVRRTETSEENLIVAVEEQPGQLGFHVSYSGMKNDWKNGPSSSHIGGPIEGNPFATLEIAINVAKQIVEKQKQLGFSVIDEQKDNEPPSHNGGFQTYVRITPPPK